MAGKNIAVKQGQVLFKAGDAADGMYLIRQGQLVVFLSKDGNEVELASIGPGGMIGEMAFFDKKPRSASVKAASDAEVTQITPEDFAKLMKQIPKWFVSIMSALSTRLRETNDRLQSVENKISGAKSPFEDALRMIHVFNLLIKDATKEGKQWLLVRSSAIEQLSEIFSVDGKKINDLFEIMIEEKILNLSKDQYNNPCLCIPNKALIPALASFMHDFLKHNPAMKSVTPETLDLLQAIAKLSQESAYDTVNISLKDVVTEGERMGLTTKNWNASLNFFKYPNDFITLVKVSDGIGFKVEKSNISRAIQFHRFMVSGVIKKVA